LGDKRREYEGALMRVSALLARTNYSRRRRSVGDKLCPLPAYILRKTYHYSFHLLTHRRSKRSHILETKSRHTQHPSRSLRQPHIQAPAASEFPPNSEHELQSMSAITHTLCHPLRGTHHHVDLCRSYHTLCRRFRGSHLASPRFALPAALDSNGPADFASARIYC